MSVSLPQQVTFIVFVFSGVDTFLLTQTIMTLPPPWQLVLGALNVAFAAIIAFQHTAVNTVRRMRGLPPRG